MFTLDQVVPWGRSFDEYCRMFALTEADLRLRILGCGDGPASFNAEATRLGARICSCDPLYRWDPASIQQRIDETREVILEQTRRNAGEFVWTFIPSVEGLGRIRMAAMQIFLNDLSEPDKGGRYVAGALPTLPFADASFDLALSSHFLFLYSAQLGEEFHIAAIRDMCRVAAEVRIFPVLELGARRSPLIEPVVEALDHDGLEATIEPVPYEFQRGGNEMMRVRPRRV